MFCVNTAIATAREPPRILIVEDEQLVALDLAGTLEELGYEVVGMAARGEDAVVRARELEPQLILMDVRLAGQLDGIQTAEAICDTRNVPVVYLTAHSDNETLQRAAGGASGYLVKPFKAPELRCVIEIALHKHASEARLHRMNEELERRVNERTTALQVANRELETFSYSVAHDLRAPLRAIDGFSQLLIERTADLDPDSISCIHRVRTAVNRMAQLIDALLDLARVGQTDLQWAPINLSDVARDVFSEIANGQRDRQVSIDIEAGMSAVADPRLMRIVLHNLLDNAWKFTANVAESRIEVGTTAHASGPAYFVRDNGAGFDPQHAENLFGAFQRLHTDREFSGTGIGLAIVQRVIHRHGGAVWAHAQLGQGATFFFTLPTLFH
jgi:signal transduction histidine kinase